METVAVQHSRASALPGLAAALMVETGLDQGTLTQPLHRFYPRVRADGILGPILAARVTDWLPHLERMVAFWSSVALMTGQYHGHPVPAHLALPIEAAFSDRWPDLCRATTRKTCNASGAAHVMERAERVANSLHLAGVAAQADPAAPAKLI
jgi:hemoglobin